MEIPAAIDRILELGEAIFRYYFWAHKRYPSTPFAEVPPPPEEAQLREYLTSLSPGYLYFSIVALEIGRGLVHPSGWMTTYLAASDAFPKHFQAVDRLMRDPMHLARWMDSGFLLLHEAGVDVNSLFRVPDRNKS